MNTGELQEETAQWVNVCIASMDTRVWIPTTHGKPRTKVIPPKCWGLKGQEYPHGLLVSWSSGTGEAPGSMRENLYFLSPNIKVDRDKRRHSMSTPALLHLAHVPSATGQMAVADSDIISIPNKQGHCLHGDGLTEC